MKNAMLGAAALAAALLTACASAATPRTDTGATGSSTSTAPSTVVAAPPVRSTPTPTQVVAPKPPPNHCAHNTAAQLVLVKLDVQRMWLCARSRTVSTNPITSGMAGPDTRTPTGHYRIQGRN